MLAVYRANRLEALAARLARVARENRARPLEPCPVAVQHPGMGRWLSLHIAAREGVSANLRFQFPAAFIWALLRAALDEPRAEAYRYTPQALCWRLLGALEQLPAAADLEEIRWYLEAAGPGARYELAEALARVYDRYLVYRPDWIAAWEEGREEHWQARLWRALAAGGGEHWVGAAGRLREAVRAGRVPACRLPQRACLFGVPALSPGYLELLKMLAASVDVHLFLLDPCREYWGDLESPARVAKAVMEDRPGADAMQVGNRLLASMGRQGRDFLDAVHGLEPDHEETLYESPGRRDRLHCLQTDLLELSPGGPAPAAGTEDPSVQVHACHGPLRELEVLHDRLLDLFERWPELRPSDVVVMIPDVESYAPLVEAVFDTAAPRIPYELADRAPLAAEPSARALSTLLALPDSRFETEAILELLALAPVYRRAGIAEEELPRIRQWLERAGVRWGIDQRHRAGLGLPGESAHTWQFGLDRLLLGCALPGEEPSRPFAGRLPCGDLEGEDARLLGRLCRFFERLTGLRGELTRRPRRPLEDWRGLLLRVSRDFLEQSHGGTELLRARLTEWFDAAAGTAPMPVLNLAELRTGVRRVLAAETPGGRFPGAGVTFCRMVPMRSVPFEVVCLLGLNFDTYPRVYRPPGFDRSARAPRPGDRRQRDDDRYLFLEALLSARRCLYLSYRSGDRHDDVERPPSVVVSELLALLGRRYGVGADPEGMPGAELIHRHPMQPFSERYFDGSEAGSYSYSEAALETCRALCAGPGEDAAFAPAGPVAQAPGGAGAEGVARGAETAPGPHRAAGLELADVEEFCAGAPRFYLRRRLDIHAPRTAGAIGSDEPFVPSAGETERLRAALLDAGLRDDSVSLAGAQAAGMLPHGAAGEAVWGAERRNVRELIRSLEEEERAGALAAHGEAFALELGEFRLTGRLRRTPEGAVYLYPRPLWDDEWMVLWLRHLVLSRLSSSGARPLTRLVFLDRDGVVVRYRLPSAESAEERLRAWLRRCREGLDAPLPLFPKSSMEYARALLRGKTDPVREARKVWQGRPDAPGERESFYHRLAFRGRPDPLEGKDFARLSGELLLPLQRGLEAGAVNDRGDAGRRGQRDPPRRSRGRPEVA